MSSIYVGKFLAVSKTFFPHLFMQFLISSEKTEFSDCYTLFRVFSAILIVIKSYLISNSIL